MSRYLGPAAPDTGGPARVGLLLVNLGTPDAPTVAAVRRYLREFLGDPRVLELPRPLAWTILELFVLPLRPRRTAEAYRKIWTPAGSPLAVVSRRQRDALAEVLAARHGDSIQVAHAMRYGKPSIAEALADLERANVRRLLVLPLYPQYASATTGSTFDALARALMRRRVVPELRLVADYHDDAGYIAALAASVREHRARHGRGERLLFSFHGLPEAYARAGDPYAAQCHETARRAAAALGLADQDWLLSFQSRFGPQQWLRPYTDETLRALPGQGVRHVDVVCPGFAADCLETLEEIAMQNRTVFLSAGGERFEYVPALNDRADHVEALGALALRHMGGWI